LLWIGASVPEAAGRSQSDRKPVLQALRLPGVAPILIVVAAYVLAHNILYTYLAAYLDRHHLGVFRESALFVFGVTSIGGLVVTGALVDRRLRALTIISTLLFLTASGLLAGGPGVIGVVFLAIALWGLGWGGVATLLQTAVTDAGGERGQALFVTICNSSIAGGSAVGGILLDTLGSGSLPGSALLLLVPALFIVITASRHAFPALRSRQPDPNISPRA
jgi:predicted MFS family arabinose efflux permease